MKSLSLVPALVLCAPWAALAQSPAEEFEQKMSPPGRTQPGFQYQGPSRTMDVGRRAIDRTSSIYDPNRDIGRRRGVEEEINKRTNVQRPGPVTIHCDGSPPVCVLR